MRGIENVSNKTVVLTGVTSGIGAEFLKMIADPKLNNTVLAVSRTAEEKLVGCASNIIPFNADITKKEDIDRIFDKAESLFGKIDIFYNNAGFPYIERFDYLDWDRMEHIYRGNTLGPVYMYTKYLNHLNGRPGHLAYTISCIGKMALPAYALYTSAKYGLMGFQEAIRLEMPPNMKLTCLNPPPTDTNFFLRGSDGVEVKKPWPVFPAKSIAKIMFKGMAAGKEEVYPWVWKVLGPFFLNLKFTQKIYWAIEKINMRHNLAAIDAAKAAKANK